ncbi:MAG TPA: hypothetical protein VIL95_05110 [Bacillota bacterium]
MSYFLRAEFLAETFAEIQAALEEVLKRLKNARSDRPIEENAAVTELITWARDECVRAQNLLATMPGGPIVYTGPGDRERVLAWLEEVLARAERDGRLDDHAEWGSERAGA